MRHIPWREDLPKVLDFEPDKRASARYFKRVEVAKKGYVIVGDCGSLSGEAFGDVTTLRRKIEGINAIVIDGGRKRHSFA